MPPIEIHETVLKEFGDKWRANGEKLSRTPPQSSGQLGKVFDDAVGQALATMVGGVPVVAASGSRLSIDKDCVEVGPVRVVGGVRPQNFDVGYRPDGLRIAFDSKTLNDAKSLGKNWQNMVNDLATEATTVHSRFPHAIVAFMFICPEPIFLDPQRSAILETLDRLARRRSVEDPLYMAEVISVVVWNPDTGLINSSIPPLTSNLRLEQFSSQLSAIYSTRYKGLPPHASDPTPAETDEKLD